MLENRPDDALGSLVETVETVQTVQTVFLVILLIDESRYISLSL